MNSEAYTHKETETYFVQRDKENFSSFEYEYLKSPEVMKKLLRKGQEIIWEKNEIFINYHFFPTLSIETYFRLNIKKFFSTPVLSSDLDSLNKEMIAIAFLSKI